MKEAVPLFTVLTPTYNRAHLLPRLYESLCRQTFRNFEWLVVDDGSVDDTSARIKAWQEGGTAFTIRCLQQANTGKTTAMNRGVRAACGTLIAEIDSDDELLPDALQTLLAAWQRIDPVERDSYVGVTGLCVGDDGCVVGNRFPSDPFVSNSLESRYRYGIRGEKWGFQRKDILLAFPFQESLPRCHIPEGIVWDTISRKYKTLYINQRLRIYHSGTDQITQRSPAVSAQTMLIWHTHVLNVNLDYFRYAPLDFLRSAVHYGRASLHLRRRLREQWKGAGAGKLLWLAVLPLAYVVYRRDLRRE